MVHQPPGKTQECSQKNGYADRLVELVELEQSHWRQRQMRHHQAQTRERKDPERHHPVKDDGDRGVSLAGACR